MHFKLHELLWHFVQNASICAESERVCSCLCANCCNVKKVRHFSHGVSCGSRNNGHYSAQQHQSIGLCNEDAVCFLVWWELSFRVWWRWIFMLEGIDVQDIDVCVCLSTLRHFEECSCQHHCDWSQIVWRRDFFCICPDLPWGPPSLLYSGYRLFFPGLKRPGLTLTTHLDLAPRLKKE